MPVLYAIDRKERVIRTRCVRDVTLREVIEHFRTLQRDPDCPDWLDVFLDLREITSMPVTGEIHAAAREISKTRNKVQFKICVVVAPSDAIYGMMRMFSVVAELYFTSVRVFRTAEEGEEWLESQRLLRQSASSLSHTPQH